MKLADSNFFGPQIFYAKNLTTGEAMQIARFGYETKDQLYDINCVPGIGVEFVKNCQSSPITPIHRAIIRKFYGQINVRT